MNYCKMSFSKTFDVSQILRHCLSRMAWYCFIFGPFVCERVREGLNKTKEQKKVVLVVMKMSLWAETFINAAGDDSL